MLALLLVLLAAAPALAGPTGWSRSDRPYQPPRYASGVNGLYSTAISPAAGIVSTSHEAASEAEVVHLARWSVEVVPNPEQHAGRTETSGTINAAGSASFAPSRSSGEFNGVLANAEPWPSRPLLIESATAAMDDDAGVLGEGATLVPLPPPLWAAMGTLAVLSVVRMGRRGGRRVPV